MSDYKIECASECCKHPLIPLEKEIVKKTSPGVTSYYQERCSRCGRPSHSLIFRAWDSEGKEIKAGDILETPDCPKDHAERYHAVMQDRHGGLEIRDTGNNNVHMWTMWGAVHNLGHWSENKHLLDDDDLDYYFQVNKPDGTSNYRYGQDEND